MACTMVVSDIWVAFEFYTCLFYLNLLRILGSSWYHSHFTDKEIKVRKMKIMYSNFAEHRFNLVVNVYLSPS